MGRKTDDLGSEAREVMDNLKGKYRRPQLVSSVTKINDYGNEIILDLTPYPEVPEQILIKLRTQDGPDYLDSLVIQVEIDPKTKRMTLRR